MQHHVPHPGERRDRYTGDKLIDTISANIAPMHQDALPCVFLSTAAGARGWLLRTSASQAQDLSKQDVAGSWLDPGTW